MTNLSNTQSQVLPHTHTESEITGLSTDLAGKQDKLVAGSNIQIAADGKTVSATDTTYTAGTNVSISAQNVISATDTKYNPATQSAAGLMSAADKLKLDGIEPGAGVAKVSGVKGDAESSYREGLVNITKANIGLGNVDNTSDANKPISTATQSALDLKQNIADMPTDLGDFTNNAGFIKNTVNDLANYYKKTETYTQAEINTLISNFGGFEVVATLPTSDIKANVIYLLGPIGTGADKYEEWIYYNSTWTKIGETSVDLTNYAQKSEVLTKTNTTSFTPTGDYQPATKKYVDDNMTTKVFTLPMDLTTAEALAVAQQAYDWYIAGNVSVLKKGSAYAYVVRTESSGSSLAFYQGRFFTSDNQYAGVTDLFSPKFSLSISDGTVTAISASGPAIKSVLATGVDYATPYIPEYDGSPATKRYVDDNVASVNGITTTQPSDPVAGSTYYDTTAGTLKVYNGTSWEEVGGGTEYNAGPGISIGDVTMNARKGPSPDGFHVPSTTEWQGLKTIMDGLSLTTGDNWRVNLHLPFAGFRNSLNANLTNQDSRGYYWSSSPYGTGYPNIARRFRLDSSDVYANDYIDRAYGLSVRCFKDSFEAPTSSWTVVQGTLGSAGIFWNQSEGLISITSDGATGYTIADKNLGATTVYNNGDTLSQANMGNMYQWGNNYGFPSTGTISNTSSTQVDASGYGPSTANGYYESDTFITGSVDWSSVQNDDLWGDTTGTISQENVITNTGVLSVNGQVGNVTIASPDMSNYLAKDNTTVFTPTGDYHPATKKYVDDGLAKKQDTLVSGTNIKTINGNSILGSGDLPVSGLPSGGTEGQILMIVSGTPTWVTPTDNGFIMQSPDSTIPLKYLYGGTEGDYQALSSHSNDTMYNTVEGGVTLKYTYEEIVAMANNEGYPWTNTIAELNTNASAYYDKFDGKGRMYTRSPALDSPSGNPKYLGGVMLKRSFEYHYIVYHNSTWKKGYYNASA